MNLLSDSLPSVRDCNLSSVIGDIEWNKMFHGTGYGNTLEIILCVG